MHPHESAEDYLEAILMLQQEKGSVRSIDVVKHLNYSKPSVSVAMKHLREKGHILMDETGYITLTESGRSIASSILERHNFFTSVLRHIGVDEETAFEEACKLEHDISQGTFEKMKAWLEEHPKKN